MREPSPIEPSCLRSLVHLPSTRTELRCASYVSCWSACRTAVSLEPASPERIRPSRRRSLERDLRESLAGESMLRNMAVLTPSVQPKRSRTGRRAGPRCAGNPRRGNRETPQATRHRPETVHRGPANLPIWHTRKPGRRAGPRCAGRSQAWQQRNAPGRATSPKRPFTGARRTYPSGIREHQVYAPGPGAQRIPDMATERHPRPRNIAQKTVRRGPANLPIWHTRTPGRRAGPRCAGKSQAWQQRSAPGRATSPKRPFTGPRRTYPSCMRENRVGARRLGGQRMASGSCIAVPTWAWWRRASVSTPSGHAQARASSIQAR